MPGFVEAGFEEVEVCSAVHLPLEEFEPVDFSFDLAAGPGFGDRGGHGASDGAGAAAATRLRTSDASIHRRTARR